MHANTALRLELALGLRDLHKWSGVPVKQIATQAEVSSKTVYAVLCGRRRPSEELLEVLLALQPLDEQKRERANRLKHRLGEIEPDISLSPRATNRPQITALLDRLVQLRQGDRMSAEAIAELEMAGRTWPVPRLARAVDRLYSLSEVDWEHEDLPARRLRDEEVLLRAAVEGQGLDRVIALVDELSEDAEVDLDEGSRIVLNAVAPRDDPERLAEVMGALDRVGLSVQAKAYVTGWALIRISVEDLAQMVRLFKQRERLRAWVPEVLEAAAKGWLRSRDDVEPAVVDAFHAAGLERELKVMRATARRFAAELEARYGPET